MTVFFEWVGPALARAPETFTSRDKATIASYANLKRRGEQVSILGSRPVDSVDLAVSYGLRIGGLLYNVKFDDGSSLEVPEQWLKPTE
jgi:hypothetical protein